MISQAWGEFSTKIKSAVVQFMTTNRVGFKYISAYLDQLSNYLKDNLTPFWEEIAVIKLWPPSVDGIRIEKCRQDLTCRHFLLVFVLFYDMQLVTPREAAIAVKIDITI